MSSIDATLVSKLKDKLLDDCKSDPQLYDECDVNKVRDNELKIERFLLASKMNLDNAFTVARDALRWRKSFGINDRTDEDFPIEFYKIGAFFPYSVDKNGKIVIYLRVKMYKSFPNIYEYFRLYLMHIINKIDAQTELTGWAMVWDLTGAGPSNWDLSMIRFLISSLRNYFPFGLQYLMVYGVPWVMTAFVNIAMKLLPEESRNKVKFADRDQLFSAIAEENIPDFLGGKCDKSYREVPKGARNAMDVGIERGFSTKEIESLLKYYDNYLKD